MKSVQCQYIYTGLVKKRKAIVITSITMNDQLSA